MDCKERGTESTNNTGRPSCNRCSREKSVKNDNERFEPAVQGVLRNDNTEMHSLHLVKPPVVHFWKCKSGTINQPQGRAHLKFLAPNGEPLDVSESLPLRKRYGDRFSPVASQNAPVAVLVRDNEALFAGGSRRAGKKVGR